MDYTVPAIIVGAIVLIGLFRLIRKRNAATRNIAQQQSAHTEGAQHIPDSIAVAPPPPSGMRPNPKPSQPPNPGFKWVQSRLSGGWSQVPIGRGRRVNSNGQAIGPNNE